MIGSEKLNEKQMILIGVLAVIFVAFLVVVNLLDNKSLNGIKAKKVGNGQHGTARWATKSEIKRAFIPLPFEPEKWRNGENLPTVQGTVVGCRGSGKKTVALVDDGDVHTLMIGAAGVGKTAFFLYPNLNSPVQAECPLYQLIPKEMWHEITVLSQKSTTATMCRFWI